MKRLLSLLLCMAIFMSFALSVSALKSVPVKSITLDKSSIILNVGKTYNLKVTLAPTGTTQKRLVFSTSDKTVATVDGKGKITAKKAGNAVITATSYSNKKILAKCSIIIVPVKKPVLKCLGNYGEFDPNTDPVAKALEEKTGYKVQYFMLPNENADDKLNLEMSSGTEYDAMIITSAQFATLSAQGALMALDGLISKYGSNTRAVISESSWKTSKVNGKIYGIPQKVTSCNINYATIVRKDILDELKLPVPTTIDQFYSTLKAIRDKKNMIPLTGFGLQDTIASAFGSYSQWIVVNGKLMYRAEFPGTKSCLEFMQKLYNEGLIDKEWPVNKSENVSEKFTSGKAAMALFAYWDAPSIQPAVLKNFPNAKLAVIQPLKGSNGQQGMLRATGINYYAVIPKTSKHAQDAMTWFNLKLDTEIHKYFSIGKEGIDYTFANGKYTPILPAFANDRSNSSWYLTGIDEKNYPIYWKARVRKNADMASWYDQIMKDADKVGKYEPLAFAPTLPAISKNYQSVLQAFSDECVKIIAGENINTYDKFLEQLNKDGLADMTREANDWYKKNK